MTNNSDTPDWDGALVIKDRDGSVWNRTIDGYYYRPLWAAFPAAYIEERWAPITVVTPGSEAEPYTCGELLTAEPTEAEVEVAAEALESELADVGLTWTAAEKAALAALRAARKVRP